MVNLIWPLFLPIILAEYINHGDNKDDAYLSNANLTAEDKQSLILYDTTTNIYLVLQYEL